jgi:hypothetical protein
MVGPFGASTTRKMPMDVKRNAITPNLNKTQ